MTNEKLIVRDDYKVFDILEDEMRKGKRGPLGFVKIYLRTKYGIIYDEGENLVVGQGREFVAQKTFNSVVYNGGSRPNLINYTISGFGVGSGGASVVGNSVVLNGPQICDTGMISPISLGVGGYLTEPNGTTTLCVKPITASSGTTYLEPQTYSGGGTCTYYTKMNCTCIIPAGEPTSLIAGAAVQINEAGLYITYGTSAYLFAHICFAPKWKESESDLTIVWYVLF